MSCASLTTQLRAALDPLEGICTFVRSALDAIRSPGGIRKRSDAIRTMPFRVGVKAPLSSRIEADVCRL
jgi:hypothetical protein